MKYSPGHDVGSPAGVAGCVGRVLRNRSRHCLVQRLLHHRYVLSRALERNHGSAGARNDGRSHLSLRFTRSLRRRTAHWSPWLRSVLGVREDYTSGSDTGTNAGSAGRALLQPKGSLIFTPAATTELNLIARHGYHSIDVRGFTQAQCSGEANLPLLSSASGEEVGVRDQFRRNLVATLSVFRMTFQSETTYNPDAGMDFAGPGSRRDGAELNVTYQA